MAYPFVQRERASRDRHVFDVEQDDFAPASVASHTGLGPYPHFVEHDGKILSV
jgi:carbonic anhydrase